MAEPRNKSMMSRRQRLALLGLRLPILTLRKLQDSGIYCVPTLSIVRQRTTQRYLIRAQECGGAVADLGCYCGYSTDTGTSLGWFQRVDTIGVNGLHSRALCPALARIQVLRVQHTYDLLITKHELQMGAEARRPTLCNTILFYQRQGTLELDLWAKNRDLRGSVIPLFYDRGGDQVPIPSDFTDAVRRAVAGATCCGCDHSHLLTAPQADQEDSSLIPDGGDALDPAA